MGEALADLKKIPSSEGARLSSIPCPPPKLAPSEEGGALRQAGGKQSEKGGD